MTEDQCCGISWISLAGWLVLGAFSLLGFDFMLIQHLKWVWGEVIVQGHSQCTLVIILWSCATSRLAYMPLLKVASWKWRALSPHRSVSQLAMSSQSQLDPTCYPGSSVKEWKCVRRRGGWERQLEKEVGRELEFGKELEEEVER